jgi:hypothetical protein
MEPPIQERDHLRGVNEMEILKEWGLTGFNWLQMNPVTGFL